MQGLTAPVAVAASSVGGMGGARGRVASHASTSTGGIVAVCRSNMRDVMAVSK